MSLIEFKNVRKIYKLGEVEIPALDGVDFSIDGGEFVVVLGASARANPRYSISLAEWIARPTARQSWRATI